MTRFPEELLPLHELTEQDRLLVRAAQDVIQRNYDVENSDHTTGAAVR